MLLRANTQGTYPVIRRVDPEADGLVSLMIATPAGMRDLINPSITPTRAGSADSGAITRSGKYAASFDGVDDQYQFGSTVTVDVGAPFTIVWQSELTAFVDSYPVCFTARTGIANSPVRCFYTTDASYNDITVGYATSNAHAFLVPDGLSLTNDEHFGVWAYNGGGFSNGSNHSMWINGRPCALTTTFNLGSVTDDTRIGGSSAPTTDWNGYIRQVRVYNRAWAEAEAYRFWDPRTRDNLFKRSARIYSFPVAGGGTTITCTPANAVASGVSAAVNLSLATTPANAVASGVSAAVNLSLATTPANAVASGISASLNGSVTVYTTPANAVASGVSAVVNLSLATTPANAVASGVSASVNLSLATTPANAVASGISASLNGSVTVYTTPANAVASGVTALITGPVSVICAVGAAVAAGVTCIVTGGSTSEVDVVYLRSALTRTVNLQSAIG